MRDLHGKTALVTGASAGLGADFARDLAGRGANLVLVARRRDSLEKLAAELRERSGREVSVRPADLSSSEQRERLIAELPGVDVLVNNAGLGVYGPFADAEWAKLDQMLEVDVVALTHLTHLCLPAMRRAGFGRILQVASTASFQPCPHYAAYAAAKAYVVNFSTALNHELRGTGVSCTTLCPGVTATEFFDVAGQKMNWFQKLTVMPSPDVARCGVDAMLQRKPLVVAGRSNGMLAFSTRFLPRAVVVALAEKMMR